MVLLRVIFVWLFVGFILLWFLCFCCIYSGRGIDAILDKFQDHSSRIPVVNSFLAQKARNYDPNKHAGDIEVKECSICFEEYST